MKTCKTALSLLLTLCLLLSFGGAAAFADGEDGDAEEQNVATISDSVVVNESNSDSYVEIGDERVDENDPGSPVTIDRSATPPTVTVNANINTSSSSWYAFRVYGNYGTEIEATVNGSVVNTGNGGGIYADSSNQGKASVTAGDVESGGNGVRAQGGTRASSYTSGSPGTAEATVGTITADGWGIQAIAFEGGSSSVTADFVDAGGTGINTASTDDSTVSVTVNGDVVADGNGIEIETRRGRTGQTDITVDGTLSAGSGTPILLSDDLTAADAENIEITVWKIEGQAEGADVVSGGAAGAAAAVQASIHYLVRVAEDETSQAVFGAHYNDGDTLCSGRRQIMLTLSDGYKLYATDGTTAEIKPEDDGNYYAEIPVGGGIWLNAVLEKTPEPDPRPEPEQEPAAPAAQSSSVRFVFDPDGGTLDGKSGKLIKWYDPGSFIELPDAPVKEGFTFVGWETVIKGEKVTFQPGEEFPVTGPKSFTALWTEA